MLDFLGTLQRTHTCGQLRAQQAGEQVVLMGRYAYADRWFESDEDHAYARDAMQRMDCLQFRERLFSTLSGGERQRVLLASCIAQCPGVMLFDEPSTYLDVHQQMLCFSTLAELACEGALCIAVTHDLNLALAHCSRVIILDHGTVDVYRRNMEYAVSGSESAGVGDVLQESAMRINPGD